MSTRAGTRRDRAPRPPRRAGTSGAGPRRASRRRRLGAAGAVAATGMAVLWTVVVPHRADTATGLQEAAIRYGHPACWTLLAVVGVVVAADGPPRLRDGAAYAAAACYAAFLLALAL